MMHYAVAHAAMAEVTQVFPMFLLYTSVLGEVIKFNTMLFVHECRIWILVLESSDFSRVRRDIPAGGRYVQREIQDKSRDKVPVFL